MKAIATALCAALCLTSCSALRPTVRLSEPQIVRVPGATRYVEVSPELTQAEPEPAPPVPLCLDAEGHAVLCETQLGLWIAELRAWGAQCYADKAAVESLGDSNGR